MDHINTTENTGKSRGKAKKTEEKDVLKALKAEEKATIYLPAAEYGDAWVGSINGVRVVLGTDQMLEVPKAVAELIENNRATLKQSMDALKVFNADTGKKIAEY